MTNYVQGGSPSALYPGDVGKSFDAEAIPAGVPAGVQAGRQFALASVGIVTGGADSSRTIVWQTLFTTAPSAIGLSLEAAMNDVDAEYKSIDTSTSTTGERKAVAGVVARFVRVKMTSLTLGSGAGFTAQIEA